MIYIDYVSARFLAEFIFAKSNRSPDCPNRMHKIKPETIIPLFHNHLLSLSKIRISNTKLKFLKNCNNYSQTRLILFGQYFNSHAVGMAVAQLLSFEIDFVRNPFLWSATWFSVLSWNLFLQPFLKYKFMKKIPWRQKNSFSKPDFCKPLYISLRWITLFKIILALVVRSLEVGSIRVSSDLTDVSLLLFQKKSHYNVTPSFCIDCIIFHYYPEIFFTFIFQISEIFRIYGQKFLET